VSEPVDLPEIGSLWEHRDGNIYRVMLITNASSDHQNFPTTIVYRNVVNGHIYSRPASDWHRSMRFIGKAGDPEPNSDIEWMREAVNRLAKEIHQRNVLAGWWTDLKTGEDLHGKRNVGELLCLIHSEISEAAEAKKWDAFTLYNIEEAVDAAWKSVGFEQKALLELHASISRAMEGHRKSAVDDKLPHRPAFRVELCDAMIRILDLLGSDNEEHPAGDVFADKVTYNANRSDHKPENRLKAGGKAY